MKYFVNISLFLSLAVHSSAGLINWQSSNFGTDPDAGSFEGGDLVALYIDVNNDSGTTGLVVNTDFTVNILSSISNMADDVFAGFTTTVFSPVPVVKTIVSQELAITPDNALVYTVLFNSSTLSESTTGLISDDSPFNSGNAVSPTPATTYDALGSDGILTGAMGGVTVIPEPTTIAVLLMGILGLVQFRKHLRK